MAVSSIVKSAIDGTITLSDGTGTPVTLALSFDLGDLSITGLSQRLNEVVAVQRRGKLASIRHGARTFPQLTFSAYITSYTGVTSAPGSIMDFVTGTGVYSANTSTSSGDVFTCDVTFDIEGTDLGDSADGQIVVADVHFAFDLSEATDGNTVSLTGTIYGSVTGDVSAAEIA